MIAHEGLKWTSKPKSIKSTVLVVDHTHACIEHYLNSFYLFTRISICYPYNIHPSSLAGGAFSTSGCGSANPILPSPSYTISLIFTHRK